MDTLTFIWTKWKLVGHKIADAQSRVVLTIVYVLLMPFGLIFRLVKDPLVVKSNNRWQPFKLNSTSLTDVKNQF